MLALNKRLSFICNYFKNLEDYSQIDLRVFEEFSNHGTGKSRKIESRASTIVKSHIRRYKTGLVTIVKTYVRNGTGDKKGMCITI